WFLSDPFIETYCNNVLYTGKTSYSASLHMLSMEMMDFLSTALILWKQLPFSTIE
ncbi:unnamed protein product, partial [Schistosoma rodhaini]